MDDGKEGGRYALFRCEDCEVEWPLSMPTIEAPWPTCDFCGGMACLLWALVPEYFWKADYLHKAFTAILDAQPFG